MKRLIGLLTAVLMGVSSFGCASAPKVPLNRAHFEKDFTYAIDMRDGKTTYRVPGSQLENRGNGVLVRSAEGERTIAEDQISKIRGESVQSRGSNAFKGMGIGALSGLGVAGAFAIAVGAQDCSQSGDPGDCEGIRSAAIIVGFLGAPLVGSLIGLLVGSQIPKKSRVTIVPTVSQKGSETRAGVGMSMPF